MFAKVVGFQKVDYFSNKKNKQVQGVSLFINCESSNDAVVGLQAKDVWLTKDVVEKMGFIPEVNSEVELIYDFDGRFSYLIGYKLLDKKSGKEG